MATYVHHVALKTRDLEWSVKFFQDVFGMTIKEVKGEAPERKLWMNEGLQLNEVTEGGNTDSAFDHLALGVDDQAAVLAKIEAYGCKRLEGKDHWFEMPDGMLIELM